ncbi:unnamed protein product [Durusdinium trenchii]|uniref:PA domain-containing protein n=1 Tax=Durusdinium trenchii TaxID=1381693 RepID=A0ABP0PDR1_9DINO
MVFEASDDGTKPPTVAALKTCDYLELQNQEPVACVHADWSERLLKRKKLEVGVLCEAPLLFDERNANGSRTWRDASGKIVVAKRGEEEFEAMARRAESSGAVGLVVVDNEDVFDDDFEMASEDPYRPLSVPAVLAPKACAELLYGRAKEARVVRRYHRTPSPSDARMLQFLRMRGVEVNLKMT